MHLLESASRVFSCIPMVHEVTAGIAAEYFNELSGDSEEKAFALVTAGPGLTNIITAMSGAYLESRDLLVVGGQVKSSDLRARGVRQNGIQEIDGMALTDSICVAQLQIKAPIEDEVIVDAVTRGFSARKGPVFIEFCLDAQAANHESDTEITLSIANNEKSPELEITSSIRRALMDSERPALLIGGGVSRMVAKDLEVALASLKIPVMTTWNAADRISSSAASYFGRPNTWGQRYSNLVMQQSDLLIAVGTRLGLQQTGFNWEQFVPKGRVLQVEIDKHELDKASPKVDFRVLGDADEFLKSFVSFLSSQDQKRWQTWLDYAQEIKASLPLSEVSNVVRPGFTNTYDFYIELSKHLMEGDTVVPSSSGSAETVAMQALLQPRGTSVVTSKGLASMGYGLGGSIGAALASRGRVFHIEGDGGFAQNLQDLGTVRQQNLDIKTFIFCNDGYASIRATQKNYFQGHYVGCDSKTGLGLPNWSKLFDAFDIPVVNLEPDLPFSEAVLRSLGNPGPHAYLVRVDPEQTYFPKITSQLSQEGVMVSSPLHRMSPELSPESRERLMRHL